MMATTLRPRTRRLTIAGALALVAAVTTVGAAAASASSQVPGRAVGAKVGQPAPEFTLVDTSGQKRKLSDYQGKIIVLEWINPDCPFVQRLYRTKSMQRAHDEVKAMDASVVWLAINSTHMTNAAQNEFWINDHKLAYPILLDADGTVGRQYDARRTPHLYVIDTKGILRYQGAVDDNPLGNKPPAETKNHVVRAVKQILDGATVAPDRVKPYGCTIKYRR